MYFSKSVFCKSILVCFACVALFSSQAQSAAFKVNPLKLSFSPDTKTTALEVVNTSGAALTLQVEAKKWIQNSSGEDVLQNTKDILFFPKIVTLKKNEKRVVRVNYRGGRVENKEKSYRLFVQELVDRSRLGAALNFSLRFSIPIFITPNDATANVKVLGIETDGDVMNVVVENKGMAHSLINKIQLTGLDGRHKELFFKEGKGWYVLSESSNSFQISLTQNECNQAEFIELAARSAVKTYVTRLRKNEILCN